MTLADRLASMIDEDGRSRYAVAAAAGIDRSTLGRLLDGTSEPGWSTVTAVGRALRLRPAQLGRLLIDSHKDDCDAARPEDDQVAVREGG